MKFIERNRRSTPSFFNDEEFHNFVRNLLKQSKLIIDQVINNDVAIHVKLFQHKIDQPALVVTPKNALLRTYMRVSSRRETTHRNHPSNPLRQREDTELFEIIAGNSGMPAILWEKEAIYNAKEIKVNSAYNYVFGKTEHFYICNDLPEAVKNKLYFSTSKDYELFGVVPNPLKVG